MCFFSIVGKKLVEYDLSLYFYLFMLLGRNSLIFGEFISKDKPHLNHLFSFFILVDYNRVEENKIQKTQGLKQL